MNKNNHSLTITHIDTLKVISDPLRLKILELIRQANQNNELRTTKQLAQVLDMTQPKLYYHIKQLEKHGFIRVADTKIVSGIVEKHYEVTAQTIRIAPSIFTVDTAVDEQTETILNMLQTNFEVTYNDIQAFLTAGNDQEHLKGHLLHVNHKLAQLTLPQVEAFKQRLEMLVEEFTAMTPDSTTAETAVYGLSTILHPTLRTDTTSLEITIDDDHHEGTQHE